MTGSAEVAPPLVPPRTGTAAAQPAGTASASGGPGAGMLVALAVGALAITLAFLAARRARPTE
ncbi:hypothetical protein ENC19_26450 [Verrucosispora sp. CWR15]|uniref:Uncharacterized protein n=1 Tax=Verrucosispora sioxanthis TaxID=2499994 RepID=A0A6M1LCI3_9ACTN|nr:hypothetical protein [Verrucosispora sioxanthis]NGM15922.1 hypothetical protein [Verrucosispora sioxanthis]